MPDTPQSRGPEKSAAVKPTTPRCQPRPDQLFTLSKSDSPSPASVLWPVPMRIAILFPLALMAACTTVPGHAYPSLAIRPGERVSGTANPVPAPAPPLATAATGSQTARLRAQARAAHVRFGERRASAATLSAAARSAAVGSEAWSVAQIALASLEVARSEAMIALADLDLLYVTAKIDAVPTQGSGDVDAIGAAREDVIAMIGEEDATLAALRGRLRE